MQTRQTPAGAILPGFACAASDHNLLMQIVRIASGVKTIILFCESFAKEVSCAGQIQSPIRSFPHPADTRRDYRPAVRASPTCPGRATWQGNGDGGANSCGVQPHRKGSSARSAAPFGDCRQGALFSGFRGCGGNLLARPGSGAAPVLRSGFARRNDHSGIGRGGQHGRPARLFPPDRGACPPRPAGAPVRSCGEAGCQPHASGPRRSVKLRLALGLRCAIAAQP